MVGCGCRDVAPRAVPLTRRSLALASNSVGIVIRASAYVAFIGRRRHARGRRKPQHQRIRIPRRRPGPPSLLTRSRGVHRDTRPSRPRIKQHAGMAQALDRVVRIAPALPLGIERDRRAHQVDRQAEAGIGLGARREQNEAGHRLGMMDTPFEGDERPHRNADQRPQPGDPQPLRDQGVLRLRHVADRIAGKILPQPIPRRG